MPPSPDHPIQVRRPSSVEEERQPADKGNSLVEPPQLVSDDLVNSVLFRLEHAVKWANWDMAGRVIADAKRSSQEVVDDWIQPLEQRSVACLHQLAGLAPSTISALRCVNHYARRPVTVGELITYGRARLEQHEPFQGGKARIVFAAVGAARRELDRRIAKLCCWRITC